MANWYGFGRSNYFRVRDVEAFKNAVDDLDVEVITDEVKNDAGQVEVLFGLLARDSNSGGWPSSRWDEEAEDWVDIDVAEIVAEHLADGEVAIFQEVGAEKLRYVTGRATAINNKRERREISIDGIYDLAKDLGPNVTKALY